MDVTSLLNANSAAAEQQRKMEKVDSRAPSRNRTPWDAGGYSLPINTLSNSTSNTPPSYESIHHDDSQQISTSTPTSPRHKFSDSRSSLSSFASSLQSATHSRFSSMSTTVSSAHPLDKFNENLSPTVGLKIQEMDLGRLPSMEPTRQQPCGSLSPTGSLDTLALVAENRLAGRERSSSIQEDKMSTDSEQTLSRKPSIIERPSSPSDAILIKRATLPSLRLVTGDQELNGTVQAYLHNNFLSTPLETHHQSLLHARSHKRALSAPDFSISGFTLPTMAESRVNRPLAEPTPPSSHHPDNASPTNATVAYPNPDTPPMTAADNDSHAVICMYIPNCDTGSQPRKAISHIFGRNKMCTRLIPQHVWVHYCRKHYQRSRYRNPKEYAKLQCDLVQQQIRRVHEWSLNNAKKGLSGIVQDWGLAIRKREQKRLDDLGGSRKRNAAAFENDSDEGENGEDGSARAVAVPATAVPQWLLDLCGKGYNTQSILDIFNRLHTEILEDTLPCFPDIEILPNIVADQDEPKSPKGYTKRTPQGHKRAQSLGVGMKPSYYTQPQDRRASQPAIHSQNGGAYVSPLQKRRRQNEMAEVNSPVHNASTLQGSRSAERPLDFNRRVPQAGHRSSFANIEEYQGGEPEYYEYAPRSQYQAPLPAPVPQRLGGQSMAAQLETNNEYPVRRPMHQRSQSDMGGLSRGRYEFPSAPAGSYAQEPAYHSRTSHYQESPHVNVRNYASAQPRYEPQHSQYSEMRQSTQLPSLGHHRAHSSSMIQSSYSPAMPSLREHQPQATLSPYAQTQGTLATRAPISESPEARALFTSRR